MDEVELYVFLGIVLVSHFLLYYLFYRWGKQRGYRYGVAITLMRMEYRPGSISMPPPPIPELELEKAAVEAHLH